MSDKKMYNLEDILAEYDKKKVNNQMPSIGSPPVKNKSDNSAYAGQYTAKTQTTVPSRPAAPQQARPTTSQTRPAAVQQNKPAAPQTRPAAVQQNKPAAPQTRPAAVQQNKPAAPQSKPAAVQQNKPAAPQTRPAAVQQNKPAAPQTRPAAVQQNKPAAPQSKPAAVQQNKPATPQTRPAAVQQNKPAAPQTKPVAVQQNKPAAPQSKPAAVQQNKINKPHTNNDTQKKNNSSISLKIEQYKFLFKQLVKRDFKGRYKRAVLGVLWSMLSPMFTFAAQALIFGVILKYNTLHFVSYLIIGNVVFHYFTDAANSGMSALSVNQGIISKINVPKSIFILSKNVSCLYNFILKLIIMFIIIAIDGVKFTPLYFSLIVPTILLTAFNIGLGYILSAWFVFYKDTQYLFGIFTQVLMYFSAIFYSVDRFSENMQKLFYINPIYCYITYFRMVIIDNTLPDARFHIACIFYAVIVLIIGTSMYKKYSNRFIYYF